MPTACPALAILGPVAIPSGNCKLLIVGDKDRELMQAVHEDLLETNRLLSGISGFLGNLTLWGFLSGLLFFFGSQFAPEFFFTAGALVAILGVALAISSLHFSPVAKRKDREGRGISVVELVFTVVLALGFVGFFVSIIVFSR